MKNIISKKSIVSLLLVFCMVLGMMPVNAFADTETLTTKITLKMQKLEDSGWDSPELQIDGVEVKDSVVGTGETADITNVKIYIGATNNADTATLQLVWDNDYIFPCDLTSAKTVELTDGKGNCEASMKDKLGLTSVSEYKIVIDILPACADPEGDNHTYGSATITKQPTFTEEGEASYTCTCGKTKTEAVDKMAHLITGAYYLDANEEKQSVEYTAESRVVFANYDGNHEMPLYSFSVPENVGQIYLEYAKNWTPADFFDVCVKNEDGTFGFGSGELNRYDDDRLFVNETVISIPLETVLGLEKYLSANNVEKNYDFACLFKFDAEHIWNEGEETKAPTCTEAGEKTYTCTYCAEVDEVVTKTEEIAPLEHTFDKEVVAEKYLASKADFNNASRYYKSCVCGEKGTDTFNSGEALSVTITNTVKTEIANYKKADDYRAEQKAELAAIIEAANKAIEAATSEEAVQKAVAEAKTAMDKIKTDAQLKAEEEANKPTQTPTVLTKLGTPAKVKASNVAKSGKVKVTWGKVEGAVKYEVYRATSKNGKYTLVKTVTETSYTDKSTNVGKSFFFKVKAISSDKNVTASAFSKVVKGTVDLKMPVVTAKSKSKKQVKLSWKKVSGAKKYEIYRATSKNGKYKKIATTTKTSYTNKKLKSGKTYYYKVKAIAKKKAANSAFSTVDKCKSK